MAKNPTKEEDQDVIVLDLKALLTPASVLISGLFIGIVLIVGLFSINNSIKNLDGVSSNNDGATAGVEDTAVQEDTATTTLSNGDNATTTITSDTPMTGNDNAKVAIVEYSDYACGYCKRHATETLDQILSNYADTGKIAYFFKGFPIFTPKNASAAYCAKKLGGNDKFLNFHEALFAQEQVTGEEDQILEVAKSVGLDENSFKECLNSDEATNAATAEYEEAANLGLGGTPGFVIGTLNDDGSVNGEFVSGAQPYSYFEDVIAKYL